MRILLVSANYRPSVGGIERYVEHLAHGLAARGHAVVVATCTRSASPDERGDDVRVVRLPSTDVLHRRVNVPYPIPAPRAAVRALRALVRDTDVVHAQDALYLTTLAALALARPASVPCVLTQHVGFVPQGKRSLDLAQKAAIATVGRCSRLATVVTAYNPTVAAWAARTWRLADVQLLPVGVPRRGLRPDERAAVRAELGFRDDDFVALFTGRDVPKKRLDVFLAAHDPRYRLVAVTDRASADSSPARLVPFMAPEAFARMLAAVDAFVLPSEAEGFPLALQEALVAGVPCVVTRGPGYDRFLREDEVLFVDPTAAAVRDALVRLASDPTHRDDLARRARAAGDREFGLDRFVDGYEALYTRTISRRTAIDARA